jgi:hypothetical protein
MRMFCIVTDIPDSVRSSQHSRWRNDWSELAERVIALKLGKSLKIWVESGTNREAIRRSLTQYLNRSTRFTGFRITTRITGSHMYIWKELR